MGVKTGSNPFGKVQKDLVKMNEFRAKMGLPLIKEVVRECLRCERAFTAIGHNNRLCDNCKNKGPGIDS